MDTEQTLSNKSIQIDRKRYRRTTRFFAGIILHIFVRDITLSRIPFVKRQVERSRPHRYRKMARDFRHLAIAMGGVMIKLGQFMSTRVDVLPPEIIEELRGLQDEVPACDPDEIMQTMQTELGDLDAVFETIEQEPMAAASLGQTHRAWLRSQSEAQNGNESTDQQSDEVVVKVQRPGIATTVRTDLAALHRVARWVQRYKPIARHANVPDLMDEFAVTLWEELDYRQEAANAEQFRQMFVENDGIYVPHFYDEYCTETVLVMENVEGIKVDDLDAIQAAGVDRDQVADCLLDAYFYQVLEFSFFHADPHPGNLFLRPRPDRQLDLGDWDEEEGKDETKDAMPFELIFIDFGMMGRIPVEMRGQLQTILMSMVTKDARGFIEAFDKLGFFLPGADLNRLAEAQEEVLELVWGRDLMTMNNPDPAEAQQMMQQFKDIMFEFPFQAPQNFVYLGRTMGILSGMSAMLNPQINPWQYIETYGRRVINQHQEENPTDLVEFVTRYAAVPAQLKRVLADLERGRIRMNITPDSITEYRLKRLERRTRQANSGIVSAAGLISGTLFYLNGETQIGIGMWSIAAVIYLWSHFIRRR